MSAITFSPAAPPLLTQELATLVAAQVGFSAPAGMSFEVSPLDQMMDPSMPDAYLRCGVSGLKIISMCLGLSEHGTTKKILDFGCGHGRVMRWIRAAYPDSEIIGTDVNREGVEFCAKEFGSIPVVSGYDFDHLPDYGINDVIWAGSVFTHLRENASRKLLWDFVEWLAPNGVAIFSTHGRSAVTRMVEQNFPYMMGGRNAPVLSGYFGPKNYGYGSYPDTPEYGISLVQPGWFWDEIKGNNSIRLVMYSERAWDYHHDIVALQKVAI